MRSCHPSRVGSGGEQLLPPRPPWLASDLVDGDAVTGSHQLGLEPVDRREHPLHVLDNRVTVLVEVIEVGDVVADKKPVNHQGVGDLEFQVADVPRPQSHLQLAVSRRLFPRGEAQAVHDLGLVAIFVGAGEDHFVTFLLSISGEGGAILTTCGGEGSIDEVGRARHHPAMPDFDVRLKRNGDYWLAWWWHPTEMGRRVGKSLGHVDKLSQRRANAKCRQLAMDMSQGKVKPESEVPTLSEWLDIVAVRTAHLRDATRVLYNIAGNYLARFFDYDPPIDRINHGDADDWWAALASGELSLDNLNRCDAPSPTTICKHVRTVKAIFNAAIPSLLKVNPFENLTGHAPSPSKDWREVTHDDMAAILDACPNDGYRGLFALCRWAGLRRDEARQLRWGDVLWNTNRITVNARVKNATTKWHKRVCPIELRDKPTGLRELLRMWYDNAPAGNAGPCDGVHRHNLYVKVTKILNAAGVVYTAPFHTARKCWETELSMKFPLHVVVAWLGNTFEVARKHYLRVPEELYGDAPTPKSATTIVAFKDGRYRVQIVPDQVTTAPRTANEPAPGT